MIIDDEFKNLLPPLSDEDYMGLQESLKKEGCRDPLVIWGDILVDGHNRYQICNENNIPFQIVQRDFKDRNEVILWIISNQLSRRNLTPEQRVLLVKRSGAFEVIKARAKENQSVLNGKSELLEFSPKAEKVNTRKEMAKLANTTQGKVKDVDAVLKHGTPEQVKRMEEGEKAGALVKEIKERDKQAEETLSQDEDVSKVKDFEEFYLANIGNTLSVLGTLKELYGVPKQYERKYNRIIKDIEDLRDCIGGK